MSVSKRKPKLSEFPGSVLIPHFPLDLPFYLQHAMLLVEAILSRFALGIAPLASSRVPFLGSNPPHHSFQEERLLSCAEFLLAAQMQGGLGVSIG